MKFIQSCGGSHLYFSRRLAARQKRHAWVLPHPQNWFQQLPHKKVIDHWWKENLRVSRRNFEFTCQLVGPNMERQNTKMRDAIPVDQGVAASLWCFAAGKCYGSLGLMIGLAKTIVMCCCHEFVQELRNFQNELTTFSSARADVLKKSKDFPLRARFQM